MENVFNRCALRACPIPDYEVAKKLENPIPKRHTPYIITSKFQKNFKVTKKLRKIWGESEAAEKFHHFKADVILKIESRHVLLLQFKKAIFYVFNFFSVKMTSGINEVQL